VDVRCTQEKPGPFSFPFNCVAKLLLSSRVYTGSGSFFCLPPTIALSPLFFGTFAEERVGLLFFLRRNGSFSSLPWD